MRREYQGGRRIPSVRMHLSQTLYKPFPNHFQGGDDMDMLDKDYYKLLKAVYDVRRLRYNVTKMSFITRSLTWVRFPPTVYREDDD